MAGFNALVTLLVLASSAVAQSGSATITSAPRTTSGSGSQIVLTFPGGVDGDTLIGSLIGSANSLTTAYVGCPVGDTTCNFTPPATLVGNPTTLEMTQIFNTTFSYYYSCRISTGGATCTESATGIMANFVTSTGAATDSLTQSTSTIVYNTWNSTNLSVQTVPLITGDAVGQILGATTGGAVSASATSTDSSSGLTLMGTVSSNSDSASSSSTVSRPSSSSHEASSASAASSASQAGSSSTSSSNDVAVLVPGVFAAALLGLAAVLL